MSSRTCRPGGRRALAVGAVIALLSVVGLAGCGGSDAGGQDQANDKKQTPAANVEKKPPASAKKRQAYRVGIDTPYHPLYEIVSSEKKDLFGKKPYDVTFDAMADTKLAKAFKDGKVDVMAALTSHLPGLRASAGEQVQMFFPLARLTSGSAIFVKADSKAKNLADLRGKKLASPDLSLVQGEDIAAIEAAADERIDTFFKIVSGPSPVKALVDGTAQAALVDPGVARALSSSPAVRQILQTGEIFRQSIGDPRVVSAGFIARKSFIDKNREFIVDLVKGFHRAWDAYNEKSSQVLRAIQQKTAADAEHLGRILAMLNLESIPPVYRSITSRDAKSWEVIFAVLANSGHLAGEVGDVKSYFRVIRE